MGYLGLDQQKKERLNNDWRQIPGWLKLLVAVLFLLVAISFLTIALLIGRTGNYEGYTGQIIDTITIGSGQYTDAEPPQYAQINIRGRVLYADGTPYSLGQVEIRSTPRYTLTDADGRFEFIDVSPGAHTISVFKGQDVLASCDIRIQRETLITSTQVVKLEDNTFFVVTPIDFPAIDLLLRMSQENGQATDTGNAGTPSSEILTLVLDPDPLPHEPIVPEEEEPEVPVTIDPNPEDPTPGEPEPEEPTPTDPEEPEPEEPEVEDPSSGGGNGGGGGGVIPPVETPPNVTVGDDLDETQVWSNLTAVDLFAERAGNYGVSTILGENVIAPGSYGSYLFRIRNPEAKILEYTIRLSETDQNNPSLPMLYRLKRGNTGADYIGENEWKSAEEILPHWTPLSAGADSYYTLEWKWDSSNNSVDTAIGTQSGTPTYILNIIITAQFK